MRVFCVSMVMSLLVAIQAVIAQTARPVPTTAKANLATALAGGKKWKADAILIQVVGPSTPADGKNLSWQYGFYSPSARTCAVVYVAQGQTRAVESGGPSCVASELKEFMDSDQAMGIARKNGLTKPIASMAASVERNRPTWTVMDGGGVAPGDVILEIHGTTGAVVDKITQR